MSSIICGVCNQPWHAKHEGFVGWVSVEGVPYHHWQPPTKTQIAERLRKKYGVS